MGTWTGSLLWVAFLLSFICYVSISGDDPFPACTRVKAQIPECGAVVDCALNARTEKSKSKRKAKMGGCMGNVPPECQAVQAKFIQTDDVQGCIVSMRE